MTDTLWSRVLTPRDLGRFLATLRAERGLTQIELANALGVSRRYIYEIERGKPGLYTERLFGLLRLLGASITMEAASSPAPAANTPSPDLVGAAGAREADPAERIAAALAALTRTSVDAPDADPSGQR